MVDYILTALYSMLGTLMNWACELAYTLLQPAFALLPDFGSNANLNRVVTYIGYINLWLPLDIAFGLLSGFFACFFVYFVVKLIVRLF